MKLCKDCKNRGWNCNLYPSMSNYAEKCEYFNPKTNVWIPCSERMPENEKEVEITYTKKHCITGEKLYLTARAFYEDGSLATYDSIYNWDPTDEWQYDEKTDSCFIPKGWFESVSFTEEFGSINDPVIAWRLIAEPYKPL